MKLEIKVPPVGESISEVTLSRWIKQSGDYVEMDEIIAELESDKATFELTAEQAGVLSTVATEGDTLAIGAIVCNIDTEAKASASKPTDKPAEKVEVKTEVSSSKESYANGHPSPAAAKILAEKGVDASSALS